MGNGQPETVSTVLKRANGDYHFPFTRFEGKRVNVFRNVFLTSTIHPFYCVDRDRNYPSEWLLHCSYNLLLPSIYMYVHVYYSYFPLICSCFSMSTEQLNTSCVGWRSKLSGESPPGTVTCGTCKLDKSERDTSQGDISLAHTVQPAERHRDRYACILYIYLCTYVVHVYTWTLYHVVLYNR